MDSLPNSTAMAEKVRMVTGATAGIGKATISPAGRGFDDRRERS
jgi:short-subunit dehydrogenase